MKKLLHILIFAGLIVLLLLRLIWIEIRSGEGLAIEDPYLNSDSLVQLCARGELMSSNLGESSSFVRDWLYSFFLKTGCLDNDFSMLEYFYHSQGLLVFVILLCAYLCRFFSASWTLPLVSAVFILSRGRISSIPSQVSDTIVMMTLCSLWSVSLALWFRTGAKKSLVVHFIITSFLVAVEPRLWGLGLALFVFLLIVKLMYKKNFMLVKAEHIQERSLDERLGIKGLWQLLGIPALEDEPNASRQELSQGNYFDWLKVSLFEWLTYKHRLNLFIKYSLALALGCFIIARPWLQINTLIQNWNAKLVFAKLAEFNVEYLSFFDLDWRFFFIFILFHIFIKRTYISLKEFSLAFFLALCFAYMTTLLARTSDWLVIDLSRYLLKDLSLSANVGFWLWFEPVIITLLTIYMYSLLGYVFRFLSKYLNILKSEYYSLRGLK